MPLTLSRAFIPFTRSTEDTPVATDTLRIGGASNAIQNAGNVSRVERLESLRCAVHHVFDSGTSLIRLNFDWMRGIVRDLGSTASQMGPTPEDWAVDWMTFAIRHQVRTSALSRATNSAFSAGRQRAASGQSPPARPARSEDAQ